MDAKGTPRLTASASNAVGRSRSQSVIMCPQGGRDLILHDRQIVKLIYHGDIDGRQTRRTVAAVRTLAGVCVVRRPCKHGRVIFFFF